jgi:hypothetical protein
MLTFLKHFIQYHLDRKRLFHTILIVVFAAFSIILYWFALKETRNTLSDEFLHREQLVARSGSQSISGFVNLLGKNIALLAEDVSEDGTVMKKQANLNRFMDHWRDTSAATVLLSDSNDMVVAQANRSGPPLINVTILDRPYLDWAKTARKGDYFVGSPRIGVIGSAKGKYIVNVASPVVINEKFSGVVSVAVILSDLTDYYITPLKVSDNTRIFLFEEDGTVLSSLANNLIGSNYFDFLSGYSYSGRDDTINQLRSALVSTANEGKLSINLPDSIKPGSFGKFLVAYSKVKVGDHNWLLAIKSPETDSDIYLWRIKDLIYSALIFTLALVVVFSITNLQAEKHRSKKESS